MLPLTLVGFLSDKNASDHSLVKITNTSILLFLLMINDLSIPGAGCSKPV